MILRTITLTVSAAAVLAAAPLAAPAEHAASYPTKAIRLIVPTVPGVPPDTLARILGEKLTSALGQPVVIENRPGAIGTIGLNAVARATPDGYTVGAISMPYIVAPSVLPHVPYDTEKDLAPVALIAWNYGLVAVSATSPVKDIPELVARARANPGALKFGSAGNATPSHLAGELFNREVGVSLTHIPYDSPGGWLSGLSAVNDAMRQGCPRRRAGVACDERTTDAVGNPFSSLRLPSGSPAAKRSRTHQASSRPDCCAVAAYCKSRGSAQGPRARRSRFRRP